MTVTPTRRQQHAIKIRRLAVIRSSQLARVWRPQPEPRADDEVEEPDDRPHSE